MSLTHCPLCLALAVVSAARGLLQALLFWQLAAVGPRWTAWRRRSHRPRVSLSTF